MHSVYHGVLDRLFFDGQVSDSELLHFIMYEMVSQTSTLGQIEY
ncbi:hypothetical protein L910_0622 [Vibrio fluvialis PG41]|uniref:Uncharacterized protein n=1 Tax=Vibrio fluvialis PG41 TaxID=1336752 RepID=S7IBG0_VIBFL|nr:hypothetical protein L910_0622 [Vibrio fluvialis PG41]